MSCRVLALRLHNTDEKPKCYKDNFFPLGPVDTASDGHKNLRWMHAS